MSSFIKENYEQLKKWSNMIVDYDEILAYFPDYYKIKVELENKEFPSFEEVENYFFENYKNSKFYNYLKDLAMHEMEIYDVMTNNLLKKYSRNKELYEITLKSCLNLCNLIDYIGHYPATYPVPLEEEKNIEMEELLEKYDIMVRYHLDDDLDKMQISSDDIVRIIETLKRNLSWLNDFDKQLTKKEWIVRRDSSINNKEEINNQFIEFIESFPLSSYQKQGKSKREEGKYYLRLQHGKNII